MTIRLKKKKEQKKPPFKLSQKRKKKIEIDPELLIKITNVKTQSNTMLHER